MKSSPQNEFGYVDASCRICPITLEEIITLQDDCIFQQNDRQRLFTLLFNAISPDLHYLMQSELDKRDGISMYSILELHVNGTQNKDIRAAKKLLDDLRLFSSKTIHENVALLEDTFRNVDIAAHIPISAEDKLYWLQDKLQEDARVEVRSLMALCKSSQLTYTETVSRQFLADPPVVHSHKAHILSTEPEACRKFLAGNCTRGAQCPYSHKPKPAGTPVVPPPAPAAKKPFPKMPYYNSLGQPD